MFRGRPLNIGSHGIISKRMKSFFLNRMLYRFAFSVPFFQSPPDKVNQSPVFYDLLDHGREGCCSIRFQSTEILDQPSGRINFDQISFSEPVGCLRGLKDRQSHVDRIPVKDACERSCNDTGNTCSLYGHRCVFARTATLEIVPGHDNIPGFSLF